ncbi:Peroxiredoxin [Candidatus Megaera venefica]|uniref:Peroxiredoxin n=1 Tax=Candidatus Megaera venefica TaxID=2055910 RepID=A0ABU5NAB0_9RICK|nr:peroxiredoxin [Candidatus Megaera venefica]MEA0970105.1 Peroxiredoxin [Candidatus Megaera venefica]
MNPFIGKPAPDFEAKVVMPDNSIVADFNLKKYLKGHKGILFFYPLDFTFVCPSEIIAFNNRLGEFSTRNTKVIAVSVDSHFSHHAWKAMPVNKGGIGNIQFPLVSDLKKSISTAYNVLNEDGVSYRATFLIDEGFNIRHFLVNDLPLGRNVDETLRMIDALEHYSTHGEVCPAGWKKGDQGMSPTHQGVSDYLTSNAERL